MAIEWRNLKDGNRALWIRYRDPAGERVREGPVGVLPPKPARGEKDRLVGKAKGLDAQRRAEVINGTWTDPRLEAEADRPAMTFRELVKAYMAHHRNPSRYNRIRARVLEGHFGDTPAEDIGPDEAEAFIAYRRDTPVRGRQPSDDAINRDVRVASGIWLWALPRQDRLARDHGRTLILKGNPFDRHAIDRPKLNPVRGVYIPETVALDVVPYLPRWVARLYRFCCGTGIDVGDACKLTWGDVDLENEVIAIPRGKSGEVDLTPINKTIGKILADCRQDRTRIDGHVFLDPYGEPLPVRGGKSDVGSRRRATELLRSAYEAAGHDPSRPWAKCRKIFATALGERGHDEKDVGRLMRHSPGSGSMTRRYIGVGVSRLRDIMATLDRPLPRKKAAGQVAHLGAHRKKAEPLTASSA